MGSNLLPLFVLFTAFPLAEAGKDKGPSAQHEKGAIRDREWTEIEVCVFVPHRHAERVGSMLAGTQLKRMGSAKQFRFPKRKTDSWLRRATSWQWKWERVSCKIPTIRMKGDVKNICLKIYL